MAQRTKIPFVVTSNLGNAYSHAVRHGWMSEAQYAFLSRELSENHQASLLVIGMGHDSALWTCCTDGNVAFVEENPTYLTAARTASQVLLYKFPSRVGIWCEVPVIPTAIARRWDYVLVDGPSGYNLACPGRQIPIAWARSLAQRRIFVHDYERAWEREVCDRFLGPPEHIIKPSPPRIGELAVFDCSLLPPLLS